MKAFFSTTIFALLFGQSFAVIADENVQFDRSKTTPAALLQSFYDQSTMLSSHAKYRSVSP